MTVSLYPVANRPNPANICQESLVVLIIEVCFYCRLSAFGHSANASLYFSNLDLRASGRTNSHSPAPKHFQKQFGPNSGPTHARLVSSAQNSPIRRYSPPQGSTGSGEKSPRTSLDSTESPESPVSTSSPIMLRRGKKSGAEHRRAPYYVADTANNISGSSSTHSWYNDVLSP